MLTLKTLLRAMRQKAEYGELHVPVPRDHAPASYYADRRRREADLLSDEPAPDGRPARSEDVPAGPDAA